MRDQETIRKAKNLYKQNKGLSNSLLQRAFKIDYKTANLILKLVNHEINTENKTQWKQTIPIT